VLKLPNLFSDKRLKVVEEAAGVERERGAIMNCLMARDFWG
jgi:hypothetical protein